MSNINSNGLDSSYIGMIIDTINSIKYENEDELKVTLTALRVFREKGDGSLSPEIKKKIEPVTALFKEPNLYVRQYQEEAFIDLVEKILKDRIGQMEKDPFSVLNSQREEQRRRKELETQMKGKSAPAPGSEGSTRPAGELELHAAIVEKIAILKESTLKNYLTEEQLYGWANDQLYSEDVLCQLNQVVDQMALLTKILIRYRPILTSYQDLLQVEGRLSSLDKVIEEKQIPIEAFSENKRVWIAKYPRSAEAFFQKIHTELFMKAELLEIHGILHLVEENELTISTDIEETYKNAKERLAEKIKNIDLKKLQESKVAHNRMLDPNFLLYLCSQRDKEITYLYIECASENYVFDLINCCSNINHLVLRMCKISNKGTKVLVQSPHLRQVNNLKLCVNQIGDEGAKALAQSPYLSQVNNLKLSGNQIGDAGAKAIAQSPYLSQLTKLNLRGNAIGDEGAKALAQPTHLHRITNLYLNFNKRISKETKLYIKSLPHMHGKTLLI